VIKAVLRRSAAVTTMNDDMRDRLIELGAVRDRTSVLPMGADVDAIRAGAAGVEAVPGRVLFVGRLVEKKGVPVLLEALRALDPATYTVHIVGDGPLRAALQSAAADLPVTFLGALHRTELAREYAASSVVVFPSVPAASGDQDGLPVALLEALAAGRPVIASDLPGLRDAIVDGSSGLLFRAGDSAALQSALQRVLGDAGTAAQLGSGAAARADEFSVRNIGDRYLALLDRIGPPR
jgi:colanic acid/amylovoran biosynthesis glycosyltransferase